MRLLKKDKMDDRASVSETSSLLPNHKDHYGITPGTTPRQSSREQGAERYRATPHGEYVNTKREGLKKLLTHPKQSIGEAIGAGMAEREEKAQSRNSNGHRHAVQSASSSNHAPQQAPRPQTAAGPATSQQTGYMYDRPRHWYDATIPSRDETMMLPSHPVNGQRYGPSNATAIPSRNATIASSALPAVGRSSDRRNDPTSSRSINGQHSNGSRRPNGAAVSSRNETVSSFSRPVARQSSDRRSHATLSSGGLKMSLSSRPTNGQSSDRRSNAILPSRDVTMSSSPLPLDEQPFGRSNDATPSSRHVYIAPFCPLHGQSSDHHSNLTLPSRDGTMLSPSHSVKAQDSDGHNVPETQRGPNSTPSSFLTPRPSSAFSGMRLGSTSRPAADDSMSRYPVTELPNSVAYATSNTPHMPSVPLPHGW